MLTSSYPRYEGDFAGSFIRTLAEELKSRGHDILVVSPDDRHIRGQEGIGSIDSIRFRYFLPRELQAIAYGNGVGHQRKMEMLSRIQLPFFLFCELYCTLRAIGHKKPRVLNSHWLLPQGLVGAFCRKITGIPHIATVHSSEITVLRGLPFRRLLTDFILKNTDYVVSVSRHRLAELMTYPSEEVAKALDGRTRIVPMGVQLNGDSQQTEHSVRMSSIKENGGASILFVGRLTEVKGCEYLIRSIPSLPQSWHLFVVGSGPLEDSLRNLASEMHVGHRVIFTGSMHRDAVSEMYEQADVVVIPSIVDSSGYEEGLPVVLEEALSMGKAVVATRINGAQELIRDGSNGLLVEQKDSSNLSKAILRVLNDSRLRERISLEARAGAASLSIDYVAKQYESIFMEAVSHAGRS